MGPITGYSLVPVHHMIFCLMEVIELLPLHKLKTDNMFMDMNCLWSAAIDIRFMQEQETHVPPVSYG
jgi:hypothetical protein